MYLCMGDTLCILILLVTPNPLLPLTFLLSPTSEVWQTRVYQDLRVGLGLLRPRGLFQAPETLPRNPMIPCVLQSTNAAQSWLTLPPCS